ncbi:MAG: hypothetical protein ABII12_10575, partial [Planctomycetota bacterium]
EPFPRVIRKALEKDPKDRYQTVNELMSEVFAVEDLSQSVAALDSLSLTRMATAVSRKVKAGAAVQVGHGTRGPLGTGSSNVGQQVPPPVINPADGEDRMGGRVAGRLDRMHERFSARVGQAVERIDNTAIGRQMVDVAARRPHWAERITIALLVAGGISFGTSLLRAHGSPEYAVGVFLHILAIVPAIMFGCWLSIHRMRTDGKWLPRLITTACVAAVLVPVGVGIGAVPPGPFMESFFGMPSSQWAIPLLLCVLLCDWPGRLWEGRKGQVSLGSAFYVGVFGFVAGWLFADGSGLVPAAIVAASSLALQSVAGLWPLPAGATFAGEDREQPDGPQFAPQAAAVPWPKAPPVANAAVWVEDRPMPQGAPTLPTPGTRDRRSAFVRSLWLMSTATLLLTSVMLFIAAGVLKDDDFGAYIVGGIVAACYSLLALSCAIPRYKNGLWRGVFRKVVFFTGIAVSGGTGASLGLFDWRCQDDFLAALGAVIAGGLMSLFVWLVPAVPYVPVAPAKPEQDPGEEAVAKRRGRGTLLMKAGGFLLAASFLLLVILMSSLPERAWDDTLPPSILPSTALAIMLIVGGGIMSRSPKSRPETLSLPIRRVFDVEARADFASLIERHMALLDYKLAGRSDLLWQFVRGNWASQFWQKDIRSWATKLNIASYESPQGGYRVTCHVNVDTSFSTPQQDMIAVLGAELKELQDLLGGREVALDIREGLA